MKKEYKFRHNVDSLFAMVLFFLFAVLTLYVAISGAVAYKNITRSEDERFNKFTALHYITTLLRNNPDSRTEVIEKDVTQILSLEREENGSVYCTYIYCFDNMVRELYFEKGTTLPLDGGEGITAAKSLNFSADDSLLDGSGNLLLKITQTDMTGETTTAYTSGKY